MDGSVSPPGVICKQCLDQNSSCTGDFPECSRCTRLYLTCEYSPLPSQNTVSSHDRSSYRLPPPSAIFSSIANPLHPSPFFVHEHREDFSSNENLPGMSSKNSEYLNSSYHRAEKLPSIFSSTNSYKHVISRQGTPPAKYYSKGLINFSGLDGEQKNGQKSSTSSRDSVNLSPNEGTSGIVYNNRKREIDSSFYVGNNDRYSSGSPRRFKSGHDSTISGSESHSYWPYQSQPASGLSNSSHINTNSLSQPMSQMSHAPIFKPERYSPTEPKREMFALQYKSDRHNNVSPHLISKPLTGQEHWVSEFRQFSQYNEAGRTVQPSEITLPLPLNGISLTHAKTYGQISSWPGFGIERSPRAGFMVNRPEVVHEEFKKPSTSHNQKCVPVSESRSYLVRNFYNGNSNYAATPRDAITSLVPPPLYPFPCRHPLISPSIQRSYPKSFDDKKLPTRSDLITRLTYNFSIKELVPNVPKEVPSISVPKSTTSFPGVSYPSAAPLDHSFASVRAPKNYGPTVLPVHKECKS